MDCKCAGSRIVITCGGLLCLQKSSTRAHMKKYAIHESAAENEILQQQQQQQQKVRFLGY
jgi:hypothetical protein